MSPATRWRRQEKPIALRAGCVAGGYPITPQTEIMEFLRGFNFTKGVVQAVESEHSAMAMCIGAFSGRRPLLYRQFFKRPGLHDRKRLHGRLLSPADRHGRP